MASQVGIDGMRKVIGGKPESMRGRDFERVNTRSEVLGVLDGLRKAKVWD